MAGIVEKRIEIPFIQPKAGGDRLKAGAVPLNSPIPPSARLHAALTKVTEGLAQDLANPHGSAPDWSDFEWMIAPAVAAMHGISPLLARSLRWRGPAAWTTFLAEQRTHTGARHRRMQELLLSIDQEARHAGVAITPLKGAALHEMGLYKAEERPMADIDLLVRPLDAERTAALLSRLGFRQSEESWKERVFTRADDATPAELGEHAGNGMKIELHDRICEKLPLYLTDVSESIFPPRPTCGLNSYPSTAALMRHLLLHAAGAMAFQSLRILQLHDIALLAGRMSEVDWKEMAGSVGPPMWWAYPPLRLTSRYYATAIPASVLADFKDQCRLVLRAFGANKSLVEVSYSYLWVKAFPGIEWSQSVGEFLRFAASRVRPGAAHSVRRRELAVTQTWAQRSEWAGMSQSRRVLRWLVARQARPATMHAVTASLAYMK